MEARRERRREYDQQRRQTPERKEYLSPAKTPPPPPLTWAIYLVSENLRVEARFHAELDEVLEERPAALTDLPNLPLTETWSVFGRKSLRGRQGHKAVKRVDRSP